MGDGWGGEPIGGLRAAPGGVGGDGLQESWSLELEHSILLQNSFNLRVRAYQYDLHPRTTSQPWVSFSI